MTKIVYFGPCLDGTGYSSSCNRTILGLDYAGYDVSVRSIKLTGQNILPPTKVQELMRKSTNGADILIQHHIPEMFNYVGGLKNIGYFHCETSHFRPSNWQFKLNLMDEIWVCSPENAEACARSGVKKPIKIVPIPGNPNDYLLRYEMLSLGPDVPYKYKFYCIGDFSSRKNILGLVQAYFEEFSRFDNVVLILKTYCDGKATHESAEIIKNEIKQLKIKMRKHQLDVYPPVILITDYLPEDKIMALHATCDCFISLEAGAAWNLPAFDAMAMGNGVIVTGWGGQTQFVTGDGTALMEFMWESVQGMQQCPFSGIYTCHELWSKPTTSSACQAMRAFYNNGKQKFNRTEWMQKWSMQGTVEQFKKVINAD